MGIAGSFENYIILLFASNSVAWHVAIFMFAFVSVVGLRMLFLFRGLHNWITYGIRLILGLLPTLVCGTALVAIFRLPVIQESVDLQQTMSAGSVIIALSGVALGIAVSLLIGRYFEPGVIAMLDRKTIKVRHQDKLTDIRDSFKEVADKQSIDFENEFAEALVKDEIYLGRDENEQAVTINRSKWKSSHVQIMGPPGTGKGVQAAVTLTQSIMYGDSVFVIDPKNDEWAPSVFDAACKKVDLPFRFLDLRLPVPQLNPVAKATAAEVEEMLYAGLGLGKTGEPSDYYRLDDRKAARVVASMVDDQNLTLMELNNKAKTGSNSKFMSGAKAFFAALDEVAELKCIQTRLGVDLVSAIEQGGCTYIIGSMRNEPVMILQKLLFIRIIQLIENAREKSRHCSIFLDEFKYSLSLPALNALGSVRDKGCNIVLAHQSLGDFANCGYDLSESAVRSTVLDTTPIKWLYRPADQQTAAWISDQTGTILVSTHSQNVERNMELSEISSESRTVSERQRNLVDVNSVLSLPKGAAVCVGVGLPKVVRTNFIKVQKLQHKPAAAVEKVADSLDLLTRIPESEAPENQPSSQECLLDLIGYERVLRFLFEETWTHRDIIGDLFSGISTEEVNQYLDDLESKRFARREQYSFGYSSSEEIWGITTHGVRQVQESSDGLEPMPHFIKRMVNPTSMSHQLDIQRLRVVAESNGWRNWQRNPTSELKRSGIKYPDAVVVRPDGLRVAIEVERSVKKKEEYAQILVSHLESYKQRLWDKVYYLSPNIKTKERLQSIFNQMKEVTYFGQVVRLNDDYRMLFQFCTYDDNWSEIDIAEKSENAID